MSKQAETVTAIYDGLATCGSDVRVLKMLAREDAWAVELMIDDREQIHLWTFGADGTVTRIDPIAA